MRRNAKDRGLTLFPMQRNHRRSGTPQTDTKHAATRLVRQPLKLWSGARFGYGILFLLFTDKLVCGAYELSIEGATTYRVFYNDSLVHSQTNMFRVFVSNSNWLIGQPRSTKTNLITLKWRGMVREIQTLYSFSKPYGNVNKKVLVGRIENNDVPPDNGSTISHLWLAYSSVDYFKGATNNRLAPVWQLDDPSLRFEHFRVAAQWTLSRSAPYLPTSAVYLNDGFYRVKHQNESIRFKASMPYAFGYTNAIFTVNSWKSQDGLTFPAKFTFERFAPKYKGITNTDIYAINIIEGVANVISVGSVKTPLRPQFSGSMDVTDERFYPILEDLRYQIRDGKWLEKTSSHVQRGYKAQSRSRFP